MTLEIAIAIFVTAAFCCYLVYRWQEALVDSPAPPPYPPPVKCSGDCNQGRDCDCFQRSCDMTVEEFDATKLNPQATWPFPTSTKP